MVSTKVEYMMENMNDKIVGREGMPRRWYERINEGGRKWSRRLEILPIAFVKCTLTICNV